MESAPVRPLYLPPATFSPCVPHDIQLMTGGGGVQKLVDRVDGVSSNQRESSERSGVFVTN